MQDLGWEVEHGVGKGWWIDEEYSRAWWSGWTGKDNLSVGVEIGSLLKQNGMDRRVEGLFYLSLFFFFFF